MIAIPHIASAAGAAKVSTFPVLAGVGAWAWQAGDHAITAGLAVIGATFAQWLVRRAVAATKAGLRKIDEVRDNTAEIPAMKTDHAELAAIVAEQGERAIRTDERLAELVELVRANLPRDPAARTRSTDPEGS